MFGPSRLCASLLWPRLTPARSTPLRSGACPGGRRRRSPRVRRVTVAPSTRRIYATPVRMTSGFEWSCPLAHQRRASPAVRVPRAGALPAASFPRRVAAPQLPFSSGFLSSRPPEDLHLPVTFQAAFALGYRRPMTPRAMPGAHTRRATAGVALDHPRSAALPVPSPDEAEQALLALPGHPRTSTTSARCCAESLGEARRSRTTEQRPRTR